MAIQQAAVFEVNPGGRDALLAAIAKVKAADDQAGVSTRVATVTAGPNVGAVSVSTLHESWESFADFLEQHPTRTQPVLEVLRSANRPARLAVNVVRSEVLPRDSDGSDQPAFTSALVFDRGSRAPAQATEELGATRDVFEELGAKSRLWVVTNGPNVGRVALVSGFDNLAGWARFRSRLTEHTAKSPIAVGPLMADGSLSVGGIIQSAAIDL